jgi:hypothetical protein
MMIHFPFIQNSGQSQNLFQTPFAFQNDFQSNGSVLLKECPQKLDENLISLSVSKIMNGLFLSQSTLNRKKSLNLFDFLSIFVHFIID